MPLPLERIKDLKLLDPVITFLTWVGHAIVYTGIFLLAAGWCFVMEAVGVLAVVLKAVLEYARKRTTHARDAIRDVVGCQDALKAAHHVDATRLGMVSEALNSGQTSTFRRVDAEGSMRVSLLSFRGGSLRTLPSDATLIAACPSTDPRSFRHRERNTDVNP